MGHFGEIWLADPVFSAVVLPNANQHLFKYLLWTFQQAPTELLHRKFNTKLVSQIENIKGLIKQIYICR